MSGIFLKLEEHYVIEKIEKFKPLSSLINRNIQSREICLCQEYYILEKFKPLSSLIDRNIQAREIYLCQGIFLKLEEHVNLRISSLG